MDAAQSAAASASASASTTQFSEKALAVSDDYLKLEDRVVSRTPRFYPVFPMPPRASMPGQLSLLAVELIVMILENLDLKSIGNVRATSYALYDIAEGLTPYRILTECVPGTLQAIADIGAMEHFSLRHLYSMLCGMDCHLCGALGTLFYIPLGIRCCLFCVQYNPQLNLIPVETAMSLFALCSRDFNPFPTMRTFVGKYGLPYRPYKNTHWLVHVSHAVQAAITRHGNGGKMVMEAEAIHQTKVNAYKHRYEIWASNHGPDSRVRRPSFPRPWDAVVETHTPSYNFLCATKFAPFHNLTTRARLDYRFCQGCAVELSKVFNAGMPYPPNYRDVVAAWRMAAMWPYGPQTLNEHVENCPGVADLIRRRGLQF